MDISNDNLTLRVACLATLMAVLWGGNNIAIKFFLTEIPPFALAGIRFFVGSLIVLAWVYMDRVSLKMEASKEGGLVLLAFLFTAQISLLDVGVHHTLARRSTILISTHPFFIGIFAHILLSGDQMKPVENSGDDTLSFLGVLLIFAESLVLKDFQYLLGDFLVLGSALLLGLRLVYIKRLTQGIHPGRLLLWQAALSIPMFFLFSLIFEGDFVFTNGMQNCSRSILVRE